MEKVLLGIDILVVDDEPLSLDVVHRMLSIWGATVRTARDGHAALDHVRKQKPHLVIVDLSMPNMSGWTLNKTLKDDPETADLPLIVLTANVMTAVREKALREGFHGFLVKPINIKTFAHKLFPVLETIPEIAEIMEANSN